MVSLLAEGTVILGGRYVNNLQGPFSRPIKSSRPTACKLLRKGLAYASADLATAIGRGSVSIGGAMSGKPRVYFAAPLFTQSEWLWNANLALELRRLGLDIVLPQSEAEPMLKGQKAFDPEGLFSANTAEIESADVVLAVLDQADPDSGTCWECGYAYKAGRLIIGIRTDFRPSGDDVTRPVNLMLARSCAGFVALTPNRIDDVEFVASEINRVIRDVLASRHQGMKLVSTAEAANQFPSRG